MEEGWPCFIGDGDGLEGCGIWLSTAQPSGLDGRKRPKGQMGRVGSAAVLRGGLEWRKGVEGLEILKGCVQKCEKSWDFGQKKKISLDRMEVNMV